MVEDVDIGAGVKDEFETVVSFRVGGVGCRGENITRNTENVSSGVVKSGTKDRVFDFRVMVPSIRDHENTVVVRVVKDRAGVLRGYPSFGRGCGVVRI